MIRIIDFKQKSEWDKIVLSFNNYDIYYYHGYVDAFQLHGDGTPILIYYESLVLRGMYVAMMRDLSLLPWTIGNIKTNQWFDLTTPYGYGGWVFDGEMSTDQMHEFYDEYKRFMYEHHFVSNFVKYCFGFW